MAHKVIVPPKKNYIPQFLKQRDINSYTSTRTDLLILDSIFENNFLGILSENFILKLILKCVFISLLNYYYKLFLSAVCPALPI